MSREEIIVTKKKAETQKLSKEETKKRREERKLDKKNNPEKYYRFRRLFFGIGKESFRITWLKKDKFWYYFCIVLFITIIFSSLFFGITFLITKYVN